MISPVCVRVVSIALLVFSDTAALVDVLSRTVSFTSLDALRACKVRNVNKCSILINENIAIIRTTTSNNYHGIFWDISYISLSVSRGRISVENVICTTSRKCYVKYSILRCTYFESSKQVVETLATAVEKHRNGAEPNDDLTIMCIRVAE